MSLTKKSGVLRQLGPSKSNNRTTRYSYIELDDATLKSINISNGLDGKLTTSLGNSIALYFYGNHLVGVETEDGKIYATEGPSFFELALLLFLGGGVLLFLFLSTIGNRYGIDYSYILGSSFWAALFAWQWFVMRPLWAAQSIQNAITIPR